MIDKSVTGCYHLIMSNYFKDRDMINYKKIDSVLAELPEYVGNFIMGIAQRTSMLTRLNYVTDIRVFFYYLSKYKFASKGLDALTLSDLENLKPLDIEKYVNYLSSYVYNGQLLSCGEKAKERKLATLRSFFKYLYMKDFIQSNVMLKVEMPKIHDKPIVKLDIHEVVRLLDAAEDGQSLTPRQKAYNKNTYMRDVAILTLFLGTGIRVSELVGLNVRDLDFDNNAFIVTRKGGNKSILYMPSETVKAIKEYLLWLQDEIDKKSSFGLKITDNDALFLSLQGKRISVRAVELLVKKYSQIAAPLKKITPHKLRSTYATNLYRETGDIYVVADVLGHSDINTTKKHYAEMSEENKRLAAKVTVLREDKSKNKSE